MYYLLCLKHDRNRYTAAHIIAAYKEEVEEMGLEGRIIVVVTDSAPNMWAALKFRLARRVPAAHHVHDPGHRGGLGGQVPPVRQIRERPL